LFFAFEAESAINLKQLTVEFSGNVDAEEAVKAENYTLENFEVDNVTLDGNTATLSLAGNADNQDEDTLTVDSSVTGEEGEWDVEFFDTTIPEVVEAKAVGNDTMKVSFSEPLDFSGMTDSEIENAFSLNDGETFVRNVEVMNNNTEVNVEFYSDFEEGENILSIDSSLEDYAGYNVVSKEIAVDVEVDEEAPELVDVKDVTSTKATLVFNEDVESIGSLDHESFYHTNSSNYAKEDGVTIEGNEVHLEFDEDHSLPNGTAYLYVAGDTLQDLWDNALEQQASIKADVEVDAEAPSVSKVEASAQNQLVVTFNEEVNSSAEDAGNYEVLDSDGNEIDVDDAEFVADSGDKQVLITLDSNVSGDATLIVDDVEDLAGNAIGNAEVEFFADDTTLPKHENFSATYFGVNGEDDLPTLVVDFKDVMATDGEYSVLDLEKYQVDNKSFNVPGVSISAFENNSKVRIEFNTNEDKADALVDELVAVQDDADGEIADLLEIGRVADAADNKTPNLSGDVTLYEASTIGASVYASATDEITVELDQPVKEFDADDFVFSGLTTGTVNGEDLAGVSINGDRDVITFKLPDNMDVSTDVSGVSVSTQSSEKVVTRTEFNEKLELSGETVADSISPVLGTTTIIEDGETVEVNDVVALDGNKVVLTFSEDIKGSTLSTLSFSVEDFNVDSADLGSTDNKVVLTVSNADGDALSEGLEVTQNSAITDDSGNKVTGIDTEIYKTETTPVGVTATDAEQTAGAAPETEVGSFDVTSAPTSAGDVEYTIDGGTAQTVTLASDDTADEVATISANNIDATGYDVTSTGSTVTFTATAAGDMDNLTVGFNDAGSTGANIDSYSVENEGTNGTAEENTLTVDSAAQNDGTITVTFNDGTIDESVNVDVTNGATQTEIATAIKNAFDANTNVSSEYNVTSSSNVVTFTNLTAEADKDVTITLN